MAKPTLVFREPEAATPRAAILDWYREHGRDLPWRRTRDPYHILVSEVMLQQTQVERVLPKYAEWLAAFPTLPDLAAAPLADAIRLWAPLGYNSRAVRLHAIARQCVERHQGRLPATSAELLRLKGVGPYTAGAIACFAGGEQAPFWDTNIRRVLTRLLWDRPAPPSEAELGWLASTALPPGQAYDWHQALMDLGATVCLSREARCHVCPAAGLCVAEPAIGAANRGGRGQASRRVAESRAGYAPVRFETTDRYFRGRVVDALRAASPRSVAELSSLLSRHDRPWLDRLLKSLERDGLIVQMEEQVRLP